MRHASVERREAHDAVAERGTAAFLARFCCDAIRSAASRRHGRPIAAI